VPGRAGPSAVQKARAGLHPAANLVLGALMVGYQIPNAMVKKDQFYVPGTRIPNAFRIHSEPVIAWSSQVLFSQISAATSQTQKQQAITSGTKAIASASRSSGFKRQPEDSIASFLALFIHLSPARRDTHTLDEQTTTAPRKRPKSSPSTHPPSSCHHQPRPGQTPAV